jgi:protein O-mannosyl-transferase
MLDLCSFQLLIEWLTTAGPTTMSDGNKNLAMSAKPSRKKKPEHTRSTGAAPVVADTIASQPRIVYWLIPTLIALATFVAFLPVLQNGFVNWDDESLLVNNLNYRGLGWQQIRWMFSTFHMGPYQPLSWITYGLDYVLWGMNPVGYHLTNLILHCANAVFFYFVSRRLMALALAMPIREGSWRLATSAAFAALMFAIHPLRVESVAWATERRDVMSGFFFLGTIYCYLRANSSPDDDTQSQRWLSAALVTYVLSLLSKATAMTLPVILLILDIYPLRRLNGDLRSVWTSDQRGVLREKIPFAVVAIAFAIIALVGQQQEAALRSLDNYNVELRLAQAFFGASFYVWKTLVPVRLSPLYEIPSYFSPLHLSIVAGVITTIILTISFYLFRNRWPAGLAAWISYVLLLMPVSGIVAIGPQVVADRYSYLPCLGWAVLAGATLYYCWRLWITGRVGLHSLVLTQSFAAVLLIGLGVLTSYQAQIWNNSETLWRHALALDEKSSFAHNNLGLALAGRGAFAEAINHFRRAVEIDPAFVEAQTNLGYFLAQQGAPEEGIAHLRQALEIDPAFANAHNTLGNILGDRGESDKAMEHFRKALETNPKSAMTYYNLGRTLAKRGDLDAAKEYYRKALDLNPFDPDVHNNLGLVLQSQGNLPEAVAQFHNAVRVDPRYARAYYNLGKLYIQEDRLDDAVRYFRLALQLQPGVAEIHQNLARAFARQGKKEEAAREYEEALRLLRSKAS